MKIIGHRGALGLAPENTLVSLRKGLEHHVDMLEFDVRVTKDGLPVLHHDPELTDPAGNKLKLKDFSFEQLSAHKPDLPTLQEVLDVIDKEVPLMIEIKPGEPTGPIIKVLRASRRPNISLASFDKKVLLELRSALPDVPLIVLEKWSGVRASRRMRQLGTTQVCMNQKWLWWGFIRSFKHGGKQLYAYTLNDPAKARRWARWGLAGVITDYPDRFE